MVDFGKTLKSLRSRSGMTQQQLAKRLGVSKSVVSFYERRERTPSPDVLAKLSRIFHVSADYLLGTGGGDSVDVSGLSEEDIAIVRGLVEHLREKNKA